MRTSLSMNHWKLISYCTFVLLYSGSISISVLRWYSEDYGALRPLDFRDFDAQEQIPTRGFGIWAAPRERIPFLDRLLFPRSQRWHRLPRSHWSKSNQILARWFLGQRDAQSREIWEAIWEWISQTCPLETREKRKRIWKRKTLLRHVSFYTCVVAMAPMRHWHEPELAIERN